MARARDPWRPAIDHLRSADARWGPLIDAVGPCGLRPSRDRFGMLVRAILSQQISSKAAASIERRVLAAAGDPHTPEGLLAAGPDRLRAAGVSPQKLGYLLSLAEHAASGRLALAGIGRWDDERIIERLTEVKGIGRWTAEMFLVFALNRPDVFSVGDLGIRNGLQRFHGLETAPKPGECPPLAEPWRPYRSVAMWYLWRLVEAPKAPPDSPPNALWP